MAEPQQYQPQVLPSEQYLQEKRQQAAKARQVAESIPAFAPFGWGVNEKHREALQSVGIEPDDVLGEGLFSNWLPQWKSKDIARDKRRESREVIAPAIAAKTSIRTDKDFELRRQDELQRNDREDRQRFDLNLNTQNLDARARELQEQGKLNMRQSMLNSVNERQAAIISNPIRWFS